MSKKNTATRWARVHRVRYSEGVAAPVQTVALDAVERREWLGLDYWASSKRGRELSPAFILACTSGCGFRVY